MPIELISMGISAAVGFAFKLIAANQENKREQFKMMMATRQFIEDSRESARKMQKPGTAFIRRFIVTTFLSIFAFLIVAPAIDPSLTTNVISEINNSGFLGFGGGKKIVVTVISGLLFDEVLRSILSSIVGFYFGGSQVQRS